MNKSKTWLMSVGLTLPLVACPSDDTGTTDTGANPTSSTGEDTSGSTAGETNPTSESGTTADTVADTGSSGSDTTAEPPEECLGIGGSTENGGDCTDNSDCNSGVCTIFTDVPLNDDAVCAETPADCSTRVTGTVFDFTTGEPVGEADLIVAAAFQAATDPTGATPLVTATSDNDGRVDGLSDGPLSAALGIVGLTSGGGYYLTATGLAAPVEGNAYGVGTNIHDIWVVPEGDLSDWSDALGEDAAIPAENLPLGEAGGVVGFVRESGSGLPLAGASVAPEGGGATKAIIRYLNDDGTFNETETSDLGIFVILAPGLGEVFDVSAGGMVVGGGTAGSAAGAIFTLVVNAS